MDQVNDKGSHLVLILDLNSNCHLLGKKEFYNKWLDASLSFGNSHLLLSPLNKLTVIGSNLIQNMIMYPSDDCQIKPSYDGQYELFNQVLQVVQSKLKYMFSKEIIQSHQSLSPKASSLMAGAIGMALCCIQKCKNDYKCSRITMISSSNNASYTSQYMNFMNAFFTAQRMGVVIDVCIAGGNSSSWVTDSILHQATDLTNGIYLEIVNVSALLEYLLWCLLPDIETRTKLVLPQRKKISPQAACFCHQKLIEIGFVCSVCLSIFCEFSPICRTCQTAFKLKSLPVNLLAKKKNKQKTNGV